MMLTIEQPTAILNEATARRNIVRMAQKARQSGVRFRPHFKTHQSAAIGEWFRAEGVEAITVSSVDMARYFAGHGWRDITIAFPVNWRQIDQINALAAELALNLLVESEETVRFLRERLTSEVGVWIEIDAGYHRAGVAWDNVALLRALAAEIGGAPTMTLRGLLTHGGNSYQARSRDALAAVYREMVGRIAAARDALAGFGALDVSIGDTPTCSVVDDLSAVDEIRPGNFVFYDLMQVQLGACVESDISLAVACPVVARYPEDRKIVVYGGAVHLSKDFLLDARGSPSFGGVALPSDEGWTASFPGCYVASLSQEHGVIRASDDLLERVKVGVVVMILPVHSCLTADLLREYVTLSQAVISCGHY